MAPDLLGRSILPEFMHDMVSWHVVEGRARERQHARACV